MAIHFHEEDFPAGVGFDGPSAVDSEAVGLVAGRDRLGADQDGAAARGGTRRSFHRAYPFAKPDHWRRCRG